MTEYRVVEMEHESGYRFWSEPMPMDVVREYVVKYEALGYSLSDVDLAVEDEDFDDWDDWDGLTDAQADAMTLASAGYGTDEDYGYFGDEFDYGE